MSWPCSSIRRGRARGPPACRCRGSSCRPSATAPGPAHEPRQQVEADVARQRLGDLVEHARVEGVHARRWPDRSAGPPASPRSRPPGRRRPRRCRTRRAGGRGTPSASRSRPPTRWASTSTRRSKSVRLSALTTQEHVLVRDEVPVGAQSAGAAEQLRLVAEAHDRGRRSARPRAPRPRSARWCVLTSTSSTPAFGERVEPDVEHRPAADLDQALGRRVGDRAQPGAQPGREQEGLHAPAFRTTPSARICASASASTSSSPGMSLEPLRVLRDRLRRRTASAPSPSCLRASMSEQMWRVSPNRYSPLITRRPVGAVLAAHDLGELLRRVRRAAADVEDPADGALVRRARARWRRRRRGC